MEQMDRPSINWMAVPIHWATFSTKKHPLEDEFVQLCPDGCAQPARGTAIRKRTLLRLWPFVAQNAVSVRTLVITMNAHHQAKWWIQAGASGKAEQLIWEQLQVLLAWRTRLSDGSGQTDSVASSDPSASEEKA
jgi:hypothetical protein